MTRKILLTVACIALLIACNAPVKVEPTRHTEAAQQDSIPTIVLSEDVEDTTETPTIDVYVGKERVHIQDQYTTIDRLGPTRSILIRLVRDSIVSVVFDEVKSSEFSWPWTRIGDNLIRVDEGATLELIARCYSSDQSYEGIQRKIRVLRLCNNLTSDRIYSGSTIKLSCCNECN